MHWEDVEKVKWREKDMGEKDMGEMDMGEKDMGEKDMGEKDMGEAKKRKDNGKSGCD